MTARTRRPWPAVRVVGGVADQHVRDTLQGALDDVDACLGEVRTAMPAVWDRLTCVRDALDAAIKHVEGDDESE